MLLNSILWWSLARSWDGFTVFMIQPFSKVW